VVERVRAAGTVAYMAPEQWRGDPPTARSDVYALGGALYAALTGGQPYPQPSLPELAYAVATADPPAPSGRVAGIPPALDAVVARAMDKDPQARYPDAGEFATALRAAAEPAPPPARRSRRRPVGRVLSTAGLMIALLCGVVLTLWPRRRHRTVAVLAAVAAVALAIGEALARARLTDQYAAQLTGPLPQGRHVGDYIHVGNAFWVSLCAATLVAVAHTVAAARAAGIVVRRHHEV
jgi:hypothetical protein